MPKLITPETYGWKKVVVQDEKITFDDRDCWIPGLNKWLFFPGYVISWEELNENSSGV